MEKAIVYLVVGAIYLVFQFYKKNKEAEEKKKKAVTSPAKSSFPKESNKGDFLDWTEQEIEVEEAIKFEEEKVVVDKVVKAAPMVPKRKPKFDLRKAFINQQILNRPKY